MLILVDSVDWEKITEVSMAYFFALLALITLQVRNELSGRVQEYVMVYKV